MDLVTRVSEWVSENLMVVLLECPQQVATSSALDDNSEKPASGNPSGEEIVGKEEILMDPSVWERLPEEILELILARLPLKSMLRLRTVCRKWNGLPLNKRFARLHSISEHVTPGFVMCARRSFMRSEDLERSGSNLSHRIGLTKWLRLPFKIGSKLSLPSGLIRLEASAGNLLCFSEFKEWRRGPVNYYVCNPVTKCCRNLPDRVEKGATQLTGMAVDIASGHYKVLIAVYAGNGEQVRNDDSVHNLYADVYDSRTNQWKRAHKMSPAAKLVPGSLAVFCKGELFWLVSCQNKIALLVFNMAKEDWRVIDLPQIIQDQFEIRGGETLWRYDGDRCDLILKSLEYEGRVFVLLNHISCKRLWELIRAKASWAEIVLPSEDPSLKPKDFIVCSKPRVSRNVFLFDVLDGESRLSTDCSFGMLEQQVPIPLNLGYPSAASVENHHDQREFMRQGESKLSNAVYNFRVEGHCYLVEKKWSVKSPIVE
eukprot:Gb_12311 [translate_table: standard]